MFDATAFQTRRMALAKKMQSQGGGVALLGTAAEVARNRDTGYPYRHDSYFYYLTGFAEPEALLMIEAPATGEPCFSLFCRDKNQEREIWDGFRYGPQAAREKFGLDAAYPIGELDQRVPLALSNQSALFYPLAANKTFEEKVATWLHGVRQQVRAGVGAPTMVYDVCHLIDEMRLRKDAGEIAIMRRAAQISAHAHCVAMQHTTPGKFEYEIEAHLLYEFRKAGSQFPAYGSIVAGGANACVLHYVENNAALRDGDLLLIDAGCELDSYASDITRTFPVNGKFSGPQRALYELVLASQEAAIHATRVGMRFIDPHDTALKILAQGMIDEGLLTGSLDGVIESGSYRRFYMHRTSHWLGMDVHDCGDYREAAFPTAGQPQERPWRALEAGMVLTIEPGIYVSAASDIDARFHGIGIRIEDDALVTAGEADILTRDVPKSVSEIEALMRG
jgi:Xaa-Pro aminopeptidase